LFFCGVKEWRGLSCRKKGRGAASPDDARQPTARHGGKEAAAKKP
jgi:hypothetical protein